MGEVYFFGRSSEGARHYYMKGLGKILSFPDGSFRFLDGTYIIEPHDIVIEDNPGAIPCVMLDKKEYDEVYQAGHNLAFLELGLDPKSDRSFDKNSEEYRNTLVKAREIFYPLAKKLCDYVDAQRLALSTS